MRPRLSRRHAPTLCLLTTALAAGCAAKNRAADLPLPPRNRVAYDAETTVKLAVAERLADERRALAATLAASSPATPTTRPATVRVPSPQLISAPASPTGKALDQGPSANAVEEALATVADANERATRSPTPDGFLNAIHYFDYAPGLRYNAVAAAGYITAVMLRPGERLLSLSCNDRPAYEIDQVTEGQGTAEATLILIKPKSAGTQSNWVITTDERAYFLDLLVNAEPNYQSAVAWHYPLDGLRVLGDARERRRLVAEKPDAGGLDALAPAGKGEAGDAGDLGPAVGPLGMALGDLNFGYAVLYQSRGVDGKTVDAPAPPWAPLRVFDDGRKTFVQFPPQARDYELPPVFALGTPDAESAELVNYRRAGDYLVLDRLVVAAEMRAGEAPQQVVKIVRGKAADPSVQPADAAALSTTGADAVASADPGPRRRSANGTIRGR